MADEHKKQKAPRVGPLDKLSGVLREMGSVYRLMRRGDIQPGDGTKLVYVLREIRETVGAVALEGRISALEERLDAAKR
jgi:hypothetical protein